MVKLISFEEFYSQFDLKFLDSQGGLASVGVLSWSLVRACEIAFSINLPVFSCIAVHAQVIILRSPDTLSMNFAVLVLLC